jgi:hypothetical protein
MAGFSSLIGAILAGFLGEVLPVVLLLVVQGSGYVIGGALVALMTRGRPAIGQVQTAAGHESV